MPRRREFGISDYLLALVIVILVGLAIVRKWQRDRTAKRAEIRKLLRLAEEEAARVEAEAVVEYFYVPAVTPPQCAVCFSPTTTRCSRCKAVRYWCCCASLKEGKDTTGSAAAAPLCPTESDTSIVTAPSLGSGANIFGLGSENRAVNAKKKTMRLNTHSASLLLE